jgi:hypothetical protein
MAGLGDDVMVGALIDRLVHHCHLVTLRGNSAPELDTSLWATTADITRKSAAGQEWVRASSAP